MDGVQLLYTKWVTHSFSMEGCKYSNTYNFSQSTANHLIFPSLELSAYKTLLPQQVIKISHAHDENALMVNFQCCSFFHAVLQVYICSASFECTHAGSLVLFSTNLRSQGKCWVLVSPTQEFGRSREIFLSLLIMSIKFSLNSLF